MCAPASKTRPDASEDELSDDSNLPSRKRVGVGLLRVRQTHINKNWTPPMWRC